VVEVIGFILIDGDHRPSRPAECAIEADLAQIYARPRGESSGAPIWRVKSNKNYVGRILRQPVHVRHLLVLVGHDMQVEATARRGQLGLRGRRGGRVAPAG